MEGAAKRWQSVTETATRAVSQYRIALRERNVALLLSAGVISEIGDWFSTVALISLSYRFGDGALAVGGMFALRMAVRLVCQAPAGAFVDRHSGRQLLFATQLLMAAIAASFGLLVVLPELWLLYVLAICLEGVDCLARPAFMVELKAEAPEAQRAAANGALFAGQTTAQLIGPVCGALVLEWLGPGAVFALNGLTFLAIALAVSRLRGGLSIEPRTRNMAGDDRAVDFASQGSAKGKGYLSLLQRRDLAHYALVCLSLSLLVQATITLFIVRAQGLGLDDGAVGLFFTAVGTGSVVGSLVAGAKSGTVTSLYPAAVAMGISALAVAGFGVASGLAGAVVALIIAGFATDFYEVVGLTYFQESLPDELFARFYSLFLLALSAGALIGAFAGPLLEQLANLPITLVALAAPALGLAIALAIDSRIVKPAHRR